MLLRPLTSAVVCVQNLLIKSLSRTLCLNARVDGSVMGHPGKIGASLPDFAGTAVGGTAVGGAFCKDCCPISLDA